MFNPNFQKTKSYYMNFKQKNMSYTFMTQIISLKFMQYDLFFIGSGLTFLFERYLQVFCIRIILLFMSLLFRTCQKNRFKNIYTRLCIFLWFWLIFRYMISLRILSFLYYPDPKQWFLAMNYDTTYDYNASVAEQFDCVPEGFWTPDPLKR